MTQKKKTLLLWIVLVVMGIVAFQLTQKDRPSRFERYDTFLTHVETGEISSLRVISNELIVRLRSGERYRTMGVIDDTITQRLSDDGVYIKWGEKERPWRKVLLLLVPLVLLIALFVFFLKRSGGGMNSIASMGKSRARELSDEQKASFDDVAGADEAKLQLHDVVDFLKAPKRWTDAGARLPRGVLLEGPPGCGKTLLARAVAGEADTAFMYVSASEFVELFVGVGAARIRDMFQDAAKKAPTVIFIDELDAVGRRRGSGIGASHDEREQTLNQLLVCMDGMESDARVVVIAATNRAEVLDKALTRPGRLDRLINVPTLNLDARLAALQIHTRGMKLHDDVALATLAQRSEGFSGAALESLANEAALLAVRRSRLGGGEVQVRMEDFEAAVRPQVEASDRFDAVDAVLVESSTQLARPTARAVARLTLDGDRQLEGEIVWADGVFIKLRVGGEDSRGTLVPKAKVQSIESLPGSEWVDADDVQSDRAAGHQPDTF